MEQHLLYKYFANQASDEEMQQIKTWVETSEENEATFRRERKLYNAILLSEHSYQNSNFISKLRTSSNRFMMSEWIKIAAVVLITFGLTSTLFMLGDGTRGLNQEWQSIIVPAGQRANVILADGTNIWLNACSRMTYPTAFAKGKREVKIDGQAYFDVTRNERHPFVVHTSQMDIEVLGTKFDVNAYTSEHVFETSLMEGYVKVQSTQNKQASVILSPNQKTSLVDGKLVVGAVTDSNEYRWKEGLYCFRDKIFPEIMHDLGRYYDLKIKINTNRMDKVTLSGKFRISDGLDYALRVMQNDIDFTYFRSQVDNTVYIN